MGTIVKVVCGTFLVSLVGGCDADSKSSDGDERAGSGGTAGIGAGGTSGTAGGGRSSGGSNAAGTSNTAGTHSTGGNGGTGASAGSAPAGGSGGTTTSGGAGGSGGESSGGTAGDGGGRPGEAGQGGDSGAAGDSGGEAGAAATGGTAGASGAGGSAGTAGSGNIPVCACEASEGCIRMAISRAENPLLLPWVQWPSLADGKGLLVASALDGGSLAALETLADTDFTTADAAYGINLCVAPATGISVRAYLDDNNAGDPPTYSSSDYPDFCGPGAGSSGGCARCFNVDVAAGETVDVDFPLSHSCD